MHDDMKIDSAQLRSLRHARAWSQEQLAEIAGLNLRTVQRVEASGKAAQDTCMALAAAFDLPVSALMTPLADSAASATTCPPSASERDMRESRIRWVILVLLALYWLVMSQFEFGYNIGKDLAERDNRRDCISSPHTPCD